MHLPYRLCQLSGYLPWSPHKETRARYHGQTVLILALGFKLALSANIKPSEEEEKLVSLNIAYYYHGRTVLAIALGPKSTLRQQHKTQRRRGERVFAS